MEDHRVEVVQDRDPPSLQQLRLEFAVDRHKLLRRAIVEAPVLVWSKDLVEVRLEVCHLSVETTVVRKELLNREEKAGELPSARGDDLRLRFERFGDAHHTLHELRVDPIAGEECQQAIPVQEVVVDPSTDQSEHREDPFVGADRLLGNTENPRELLINLGVDRVDEGERQRCRHAGVALDDVRVVPDVAGRRLRIHLPNRRRSGCDVSRL